MDQLLHTIKTLPKRSIIMISGFGGAGKSTLASALANHIQAEVIPFDDFYRDIQNDTLWGCYDYNRFINDIIVPYKQKQSKDYLAYNWINPNIPIMKKWNDSDYLIIEGVGLFHPDILALVDFSIWIDCSIELAFENGKYRDKYEYGLQNEVIWDGIWKENDLSSFQQYQPLRKANYIFKCRLKNKVL